MAEQEELNLVVKLVDEASAGLGRLRGEFAKISSEGKKLAGGEGGASDLEKSKRRLEDLGSGAVTDRLNALFRRLETLQKGGIAPLVGWLTQTSSVLGTVLRGFGLVGGAVGGLGLAFNIANQRMGEFSKTLNEWNQLSNLTGVSIGVLRNASEQLRQSGLSTEQTTRIFQGASESMSSLTRNFRAFQHQVLQQTPFQAQGAMRERLLELQQIARSGDFEGFINRVRQIGEEIERNAPSRERGAQARQQWLDIFKMPGLENVRADLTKATAEQIRLQEELNARAREYQAITERTKASWERISNLWGAFLVSKIDLESSEKFAATVEKIVTMMLGRPRSAKELGIPEVPIEEGMKGGTFWENMLGVPPGTFQKPGTQPLTGGAMPLMGGGGEWWQQMRRSTNVEDRRGLDTNQELVDVNKRLTEQVSKLNDFYALILYGTNQIIVPGAGTGAGIGRGIVPGAGTGAGIGVGTGVGTGGRGGEIASLMSPGGGIESGGGGLPSIPRTPGGGALSPQRRIDEGFSQLPGFGSTGEAGAGRSVGGAGGGAVPGDDFFTSIAKAEGTFDKRTGQINYNEVLGKGAYGRPSKPLTEMTLAEAYQFGRSVRARHGSSSAIGAFQIVGQTMKDIGMPATGLKWTDKFSPENQRKMAIAIMQRQGLGAWEGFKQHPGLRQRAAQSWGEARKGGGVAQGGMTRSEGDFFGTSAGSLPTSVLGDTSAAQRGFSGVDTPATGRFSPFTERMIIDKAGGGQNVNVNGTGKITVDVNAPKGTRVSADGGGLFKKVETNRNIQMTPSDSSEVSDFALGVP